MRLVFLDESGRSRDEPTMVVAGVIVHGDRIYRRLEDRLREIVAEFVPPDDRDGLILSAKDLFHGGGYFKGEEWPAERRFPILQRLAGIPAEFGLPVVFGSLNKEEYREEASVEVQQIVANSNNRRDGALFSRDREHLKDIAVHIGAFARAEMAIDWQMKQYPRDEIAMLIAEDTDRVKRAVKDTHAFLRSPTRIKGTEFESFPNFPLKKIVDTVQFADKADSLPLQVADVCAFLIMRRLRRREKTQSFFELIAPQISWNSAPWGDPMGSEQIGGGKLY